MVSSKRMHNQPRGFLYSSSPDSGWLHPSILTWFGDECITKAETYCSQHGFSLTSCHSTWNHSGGHWIQHDKGRLYIHQVVSARTKQIHWLHQQHFLIYIVAWFIPFSCGDLAMSIYEISQHPKSIWCPTVLYRLQWINAIRDIRLLYNGLIIFSPSNGLKDSLNNLAGFSEARFGSGSWIQSQFQLDCVEGSSSKCFWSCAFHFSLWIVLPLFFGMFYLFSSGQRLAGSNFFTHVLAKCNSILNYTKARLPWFHHYFVLCMWLCVC